MERKKKNSKLGFVAGFLYGGRMCLVTLPRKEEAPARGKEEHAVVLSSMRTKRMRMTPPSVIWRRGMVGWLGRAGLRWWGFWWAVVLGCGGLAGKPLFSLCFYFLFFIFSI
jgi:hypothetical protein